MKKVTALILAAMLVMVMLAAGVAFAIISRIFKGDEITF